ncbi:hypothetical protein MMC16_007663 [Acarospora aff. strigata]|nr:hypothetical protein [Acarospora aff. strigata]
MATNNNSEVQFGPSVPFGHPAWRPPGSAKLSEGTFSVKYCSDTEVPTPKPHRGRRRSSSFSIDRPLNLNAVNKALITCQDISMNTSNMFPAFLDNSPSSGNLAAIPRQSPSPIAPHQVNSQVNGAGMNGMNGMNVGLPMNAGHQMDLNVLFNQVEELSQLLKENREKTQAIIASAEELAARAAASGAHPTLEQANSEIMAARVADLQRQLSNAKNTIEKLNYERREDLKLLKEYEAGVGHITEMVRNYAYTRETELLRVEKHYNGLLQVERDAHLASRLEGLQWQEKFVDIVGKMRHAYRLRCDEDDVPIRVVAGLQNEVRAYRNAMGMEPERFEDEYGYEILKDVPGGAE